MIPDSKEGGDDTDAAKEGDCFPEKKETGKCDVLAAHYDEKFMRWVFPQEDAVTPTPNDRLPNTVPERCACKTNPSAAPLTD